MPLKGNGQEDNLQPCISRYYTCTLIHPEQNVPKPGSTWKSEECSKVNQLFSIKHGSVMYQIPPTRKSLKKETQSGNDLFYPAMFLGKHPMFFTGYSAAFELEMNWLKCNSESQIYLLSFCTWIERN